MAQHDYVISDDTGANVLADLNNLASALKSLNSGASAPSSTAPGMLWYDTGNGLLKIRNAADSGWNTLFSIDGTPYSEGSALTVGTEIGDIVALQDAGDTDSTPTLPAVDARNLTNLPASADSATAKAIFKITDIIGGTLGITEQYNGGLGTITCTKESTGVYTIGWDNALDEAFPVLTPIHSAGNIAIATHTYTTTSFRFTLRNIDQAVLSDAIDGMTVVIYGDIS